MSRTKKVKRLDRRLLETEMERDKYRAKYIAANSRAYTLENELKMMRQELEDMKMCFDTPALLHTQAGGQ